MKQTFFWILLIAFGLVTQVNAGPVEIRNNQSEIDLWRHAEIWIDAQNQMPFDLAKNQHFSPLLAHRTSPTFNFTDETVWMRIQLTNLSDKNDFVVSLDHVYLSSLDLYVETGAKTTLSQLGLSRPFSKEEVPYYGFAEDLSLEKGVSTQLYIRAQSKFPISLPLQLETKAHFQERLRILDRIFWLYIGIISTLIIYNFFVFISVRDPAYLYYAFSMLALHFFTNLTQYGITRIYFMPHWTWFHSHVFHFAHFLSVSSVFLFARQFLSLPKFFPKSYRALALLTLIHIPLLLLGLLTRTSLVDAISQIDTTLFSLLLLAITIMGVRMRLRPAYYFAVSWSFLIFAWTTNFLRIDGVLANTIWTKYSVLMGAALEGTLLSLALGDRFNILREENEVALRAAAEHRAKAILASQVSHDIRSPLSALNMVVSCLTDVSEEKRLLIRKAVQRISDIANQLSHQSKGTSLYQKKAGGTMLAGVVLVIIGEKRMQYQANSNIEIRTDLAHGYGLFAEVGPDELARVISNLVDNSVEAIDLGRDGDIVVSLSQIDQNILIQVKDNGRGIPPHVLRQLGSRGVSFGKPKGSGLGLWHAKTTAETCGGTLHVTSRPGLGTDVTLTFPALPPPPWFLNALHLKPTHTLISVDDDQSIHAVWGERLRPFCREGLQHRTFSSMKAFSRWLRETREFQANCLFMIDYEFLDETGDGLSLIQTEDIAKQSVLVTSHFADAIYQRASSLGVCVIPKNMVEQIPIYFTETRPPQHSEPAPPWLS